MFISEMKGLQTETKMISNDNEMIFLLHNKDQEQSHKAFFQQPQMNQPTLVQVVANSHPVGFS